MLAYRHERGRLPDVLRWQLVRNILQPKPEDVVWEAWSSGSVASGADFEDLGAALEPLYRRWVADWRRTHP